MKIKLISGGGNSFCEAISNIENKNLRVIPSREKCLYVIYPTEFIKEDEKSEYEKYLFTGDSGGTIIFSTDVNSVELSENPFKNFILKKFRTFRNRISAKKILDKIRRKNNIYCWTIGRYLLGVYTGKNGKTFNENSISINIIGESETTILNLAKEICEKFNQECVLVQIAKTNQIYFVEL